MRLLLIAAVFWCTACVTAQEINGLRRENVARRADGSLPSAQDIARWQTEHAKQVAEKARRMQLYRQDRDQVRKSLPHLVEAGQSFQTNFVQPAATPAARDEEERAQKRDQLLLVSVFIFILVVASMTLRRHRREAESEKLAVDYLSGGVEAVTALTPEWFDIPAPNAPRELPALSQEREERKHVLADFFAGAPEHLKQIRNALRQAGRALEPAEKQKWLDAMAEQIRLLRNEADCWDLRPVWQLTSALVPLVKRLADGCKDATPSTLRTVAHAVDLLGEIVVPASGPT